MAIDGFAGIGQRPAQGVLEAEHQFATEFLQQCERLHVFAIEIRGQHQEASRGEQVEQSGIKPGPDLTVEPEILVPDENDVKIRSDFPVSVKSRAVGDDELELWTWEAFARAVDLAAPDVRAQKPDVGIRVALEQALAKGRDQHGRLIAAAARGIEQAQGSGGRGLETDCVQSGVDD